jgi:hypothetical protein
MKPRAADIAGARVGHRHGETDRDSGIDGVASLPEHIDADTSGARFLSGYHAVARHHLLRRRKVQQPARRLPGARRGRQQHEEANEEVDGTDRGHAPVCPSRRGDAIYRK